MSQLLHPQQLRGAEGRPHARRVTADDLTSLINKVAPSAPMHHTRPPRDVTLPPGALPVTAKELRTATTADRGKKQLVLVPAVIGNAKTAMDSSSKTMPSHVASTFDAGQDRPGNAAVAGAAMRVVPMAVPKKESHPGR